MSKSPVEEVSPKVAESDRSGDRAEELEDRGQTMVGVRIMPNSGADARDGESKKRNHEGKLINGQQSPRSALTIQNGPSTAVMNGTSSSKSLDSALSGPNELDGLPPELVHITSEHYHPLSRLLERISLECFNDLQAVLGTMADMQTSQQSNGPTLNGQAGHVNGALENSEINKQKKMLLIQFAQTNRAKFIKLLVLTQWGKKSSQDLTKLIDLFAWGKEQEMHMDMVDKQIEQFKIALSQARQYNPDIRTALQILSTGKAEWIPHLGYVPPQPVSSSGALKLLRHLNTTASIRLNVYDQVPRPLKNWHVANGRAVFTVSSEFEMELLTFTEETTEQWHFIDLRLLFSPAPVIDAETSRFWANFKPHVDKILRDSGLQGCFEYLHNFVLTHKIAILKSQAYQLARSAWAGAIKVEPVHRMLVVQYWTDKPGKKSWVEIGISSCKLKGDAPSWRGQPVSKLTIRWFRQGTQVPNIDLGTDFHQLSFERILKTIISLHIRYLLGVTRDALSPKMPVTAKFSDTEPGECLLGISLGRPDNRTTLSVEPVTGRYILKPFASISAKAEQTINQARDPAASHAATVTQLLAQLLQDNIQHHAQQLGWKLQTRQTLRIDTIRQYTTAGVLQYSLYWPRGWPSKWGLVTVIDASGENWWFFELGTRGTEIRYSEQLQLHQPGPRPPISRATLSSIERVAVQQLAFSVTRRECQKREIPHTLNMELVLPSVARHAGATQGCLRGWVLQLRTSDLLETSAEDGTWLEPFIRVMCQGVKSDNGNICHIASGTMIKSVAAHMKKLMSSSRQSPFTFSENGNFAVLLTTPFGDELITELSARLRDVDRLRSFSTTLQKRRMRLKSSSLQHIGFQYGGSSLATVDFSSHSNIKVDFGIGNPQNRIRTHLIEMINERSPFYHPGSSHTGLDQFCSTLLWTRPTLVTLAELENMTVGTDEGPRVHVHDVRTYRITYANPVCSFDIRLRTKDDKAVWHIEDNDKKAQDSKPSSERNPTRKRLDSVKVALGDLFKGQGDGWFGVRSGLLATIDGVPNALRTLHKTVKTCAVEGGALPYAEIPLAAGQTPHNAAHGHGQSKGLIPSQASHRGGQGHAIQGVVSKQTNGKRQDIIEID
ncbi:MED14-domain-containing protein [Aaosphaeria arxii CBS 175.79]|uniref:Mediator of RNA polymerase II transcription subunit 14 n=1 Tax=Aaosphaeria arxii CBS 175.79 TaxID=1450172 RepID=A0A6A5XEX7_9PLEO|nr:MED14-domain-containing protein [Aaosphaeria arxii CBS 175.79]KAF2011795.1 MED14-domain-containing protein [Aaosphaeria arxii CBS 175.79]